MVTGSPGIRDTDASEYPVIDPHAARSWHFPLNQAKRQYQFDIIQEALLRNTLVALPTGLGKTFIAAVVIYNFYRWFPQGQIVFSAPTRPLVIQQLAATLGSAEIDPAVTIAMTESQSPTQRQSFWLEKRVFFVTPQVLQSDLISGICEVHKFVLLVFDEVHGGLENHPYCDIIRLVSRQVDSWKLRILALTATLASNVGTVQQLINRFMLSSIAIRTENSPDVRPYTHERVLETIVVPESEDIKFIRVQLESTLLKPYLEKLYHIQAITDSEPSKFGSLQLVQARDSMRKRSPKSSQAVYRVAEELFSVLISLYHSYELLILHGIIVFKTSLTKLVTENHGTTLHPRVCRELNSTLAIGQLISYIETRISMPAFISHPKIDLVESKLVQHFSSATHETRAIVFSKFRESVYEIVGKLAQHSPLIRVMPFVGQSSESLGRQHITRKQQILQSFITGGYNVLVATCILEEGLDIGDVDLIICFDMQSSPISMLQRMGRAGRHRDGKIILLMSSGLEEVRYKKTIVQHQCIQKAISNQDTCFSLYRPQQSIITSLPVCIEREFNLSKNQIYLGKNGAVLTTAPGPKNMKTYFHPGEAQPLPSTALVEQAYTLSLGKYLEWQKSLGATFLVPHSCTTVRLFRLFSDFESLENLPEPLSISYAASKPPTSTFMPCEKPRIYTERHRLDKLEDRMLQAIAEMSVYTDPNHAAPNKFKYLSIFEEILGNYGMKDGTIGAVDSNSLNRTKDLILKQEDIPDNFFDEPFTPEIRIINRLSQLTDNNPTSSKSTLVKAPQSVQRSQRVAFGKVENPNMKAFNLEPKKLENSGSLQLNSSQIQVLLPKRRQLSTIIASSSTSLDSEIASPKVSKQRCLPGRSKYLDYEAGCVNETEDDDNDEDSSHASLNAFIDDRSELTVEGSGNPVSGSQEETVGPPSFDDMMAFYRRTALQSQVDPRFKTAPRQFAKKIKLKLQPVTDLSLSEPECDGMVTDLPLDDIDWSSDLDL